MKEAKSPKKPLIFYYLMAMIVLMLLNALVFPALFSPKVTEVGYNQFLSMVEQNQIAQ
ncbi:MAG: ATP-dependent metallopeptidase FtsH/Yme1/Tma family protein, partial [Clostridia bacterium]